MMNLSFISSYFPLLGDIGPSSPRCLGSTGTTVLFFFLFKNILPGFPSFQQQVVRYQLASLDIKWKSFMGVLSGSPLIDLVLQANSIIVLESP